MTRGNHGESVILLRSPLLLGVLETARVLLKLETVQARIMVRDHPTCEGTVEEDRESIAPRNAGWAAGGTEGQLNEDQDEESQLLWKIGRLMELFLSPEIQVHTDDMDGGGARPFNGWEVLTLKLFQIPPTLSFEKVDNPWRNLGRTATKSFIRPRKNALRYRRRLEASNSNLAALRLVLFFHFFNASKYMHVCPSSFDGMHLFQVMSRLPCIAHVVRPTGPAVYSKLLS